MRWQGIHRPQRNAQHGQGNQENGVDEIPHTPSLALMSSETSPRNTRNLSRYVRDPTEGSVDKSRQRRGAKTRFRLLRRISFGAVNVAVPQQSAESCEKRPLRSDDEKAGEAMRPPAEEGQKAEEHIDEQCRPHLPAHGIGAVAEEPGELEGLLEEGFDGPAVPVKISDAGRAPLQVVRKKDHLGLG